jgi:ribosomal-protein-alanine N-acetyltransferase
MGVASKLIEAMTIQGKELEMIGLTLEVRVSNQAAINLYEKYGFKAEGLRKRYYKDTGEDAIIMWKYFIKSNFEEQLNKYLNSHEEI